MIRLTKDEFKKLTKNGYRIGRDILSVGTNYHNYYAVERNDILQVLGKPARKDTYVGCV